MTGENARKRKKDYHHDNQVARVSPYGVRPRVENNNNDEDDVITTSPSPRPSVAQHRNNELYNLRVIITIYLLLVYARLRTIIRSDRWTVRGRSRRLFLRAELFFFRIIIIIISTFPPPPVSFSPPFVYRGVYNAYGDLHPRSRPSTSGLTTSYLTYVCLRVYIGVAGKSVRPTSAAVALCTPRRPGTR